MDEAFHFTTLTGSPAPRRPLIRPQAGTVSAPWLSVSASQNAAQRDVSTKTSPNCSPGVVEPGTVSARVGWNNYGLFNSWVKLSELYIPCIDPFDNISDDPIGQTNKTETAGTTTTTDVKLSELSLYLPSTLLTKTPEIALMDTQTNKIDTMSNDHSQ